MTHHEHDQEQDRDFTERAADATEESRREHADRGIEDDPASGLLVSDPPDEEVDPRT
jgi:hypothetical protein